MREKEEQLKKYAGEIETINYLISYLRQLSSGGDAVVEQKKEVKVDQTQISAKLAGDAQWKKEKGLELIKSKKDREDEEPEKKYKKKNKKKNQAKEEESQFRIPYNVENMFAKVKIAAPNSIDEVANKIKELQERELLFERVARQEGSKEETDLAEEIRKEKGEKKGGVRKEGVSKAEEQFPSI